MEKTTTVGRDMIELKLQQRLLREKLTEIGSKESMLNRIVAKKRHDKNSSMYVGDTTTPDETLCVGPHTIGDYRYRKGRGTVSLPSLKQYGTRNEIPTTTTIGFGKDIDAIRLRHMQRTDGKREFLKRTKAKAEVEAKRKIKKDPLLFEKRNVPASMFPDRYARGELPCTIEHGKGGQYLSWVCPLENLDYEYYLPIFFDGLQCNEPPVSFFVRQGIEDLLFAAQGQPERILLALPNLVRPLRNALCKFEVPVLLAVLKALRQLVAVDPAVGLEFSKYFRQFLQPMNAFLDVTKNTGDTIDYGQRFSNDIGEEVRITLEAMERTGGPQAYKRIKFAIPPYQSCFET
jgi:hypothetical protein